MIEKPASLIHYPDDSDRVRAAMELNEPGVFHSEAPAATLFTDFAGLSRRATRFHYEKERELNIDESNLVSTEQTLRESDQQAAASRAMVDYFGGLNLRLRPLFIAEHQTIPLPIPQESLNDLARMRLKLAENRTALEKLIGSYSENGQKEEVLSTALQLVGVGYAAKAGEFGLSEWSVLAATQAKTAASHEKRKSATSSFPRSRTPADG